MADKENVVADPPGRLQAAEMTLWREVCAASVVRTKSTRIVSQLFHSEYEGDVAQWHGQMSPVWSLSGQSRHLGRSSRQEGFPVGGGSFRTVISACSKCLPDIDSNTNLLEPPDTCDNSSSLSSGLTLLGDSSRRLSVFAISNFPLSMVLSLPNSNNITLGIP
jgi:hypothetical protein